jgi:hypothetical protein
MRLALASPGAGVAVNWVFVFWRPPPDSEPTSFWVSRTLDGRPNALLGLDLRVSEDEQKSRTGSLACGSREQLANSIPAKHFRDPGKLMRIYRV